MDKIKIDVPSGIRFISEWEGFNLPPEPSIINKQITGCGFTEWCIRSTDNIVLCSPRCVLLDNKEEQHPGEVFYLRNDSDKVVDVDKDLNKDDIKSGLTPDKVYTEEELAALKEHTLKMRENVFNYYMNTVGSGRPCKILVTYDSFRHVKEALGDRIKDFHIVVDEFQSIFTDSRFKSSTEMEFLNFLQDIRKLSFVSATPMMDDYLEMLPEFKNLPYYELDWGSLDPGRIIRPELNVKPCQSILPIAEGIIKTYQDGNFQKYTYRDDSGNIREIESKELVVYVNSVKNICDIIRRCGLSYSNTNVLCSNTPDNQKKIRKAFDLKKSDPGGIGTVPKRGEFHKMFTLCTRTVYLGADFYSLCARSLILSDANIECLAVDITLDLPQILGRQRLRENPWKNRAELYFKSTGKKETIEELRNRINSKKLKTENLLLAYSQVLDFGAKHDLADAYKDRAIIKNYKSDYVAVNTRGGKDLYPVFNNLVMVSEIRAFEIQQVDYKDRFSVVNQIQVENNIVLCQDSSIDFLTKFDSYTRFTDKMKLLCSFDFISNGVDLDYILDSIPIVFKNYYLTVGPEKIRNLQYKNSVILEEYNRIKGNQLSLDSLKNKLYSAFLIGNRYTKVYIKTRLTEIYNNLGIQSSPKATDIEDYFEVKKVQIINKETGKKDHGYELIKIKEQ